MCIARLQIDRIFELDRVSKRRAARYGACKQRLGCIFPGFLGTTTKRQQQQKGDSNALNGARNSPHCYHSPCFSQADFGSWPFTRQQNLAYSSSLTLKGDGFRAQGWLHHVQLAPEGISSKTSRFLWNQKVYLRKPDQLLYDNPFALIIPLSALFSTSLRTSTPGRPAAPVPG